MKNLYDLLPLIVRLKDMSTDAGGGAILERFFECIQEEVENTAEEIEGLRSLNDTDRVSLEFLVYLSQQLGTLVGDGSEEFRRWFIRNLVDFYKIKGTIPSWQSIWRHFASGHDYSTHELYKTEENEVEDYSVTQDVDHPYKAARFDIWQDGIPLTPTEAQEIYQFINRFRPVHVLLRQVLLVEEGEDLIYRDMTETVIQTSRVSISEELQPPSEDTLDLEIICGHACQNFCQAECELSCQQSEESGQPGCNTSCETSCEHFCEFACQTGSCEFVCETGCETHCEFFCETACESDCQIACETSCQVACEYWCEISCQGGCQISCETGGCETHCENWCENQCQSACQIGSCEIFCETTCETGCETCCETSCEVTCEVGCQTSCETGCQTGCETGCEISCEIDCQTYCQSTCQLACQAACQMSCEGGNQICTTNCQTCCQCNGCEQSCTAHCTTASCEGDCESSCQYGCTSGCQAIEAYVNNVDDPVTNTCKERAVTNVTICSNSLEFHYTHVTGYG